MKKLLSVAAFMLMLQPVFAQFYVRSSIGYNLPANSQLIGESSSLPYESSTTSYKGVYGSYGSGFSIQAAVGGSISGTLGYDIELGYLLGRKYTLEEFYEGYTDPDDYLATVDQSSQSFQVAPSLTFIAGIGKVQPYTRIGPVLALTSMRSEIMKKYNSYDYQTGQEIPYHEAEEFKFNTGFSFGFKGVVGVNYELSEMLYIFSEISFISLSYSPKERELVSYTVNGEDALDTVDPEYRKIEYKKEYEAHYYDNQPIREKKSMGSIGLHVGVKYVLK
ncbi:MAG: hypothetical protein KF845_12570 [Cyclobacteriaceae bacterium]|nr:hypothetical protein [Cyclobacteriaceae bacterium]